MRKLYHPPPDNITLPAILYALSDSYRLEIVRQLALQDELTCGALCMPVAKSTLSHHFKVLREAGVIQSRQDGRECYNSIRHKDLEARFPGLLAAILQAAQPMTFEDCP